MVPKKKISRLRTTRKFLSIGTCSGALCNAINWAYGHPMKLEEEATSPLAGGILQNGYQCGALWGAAIAAGAEAFRRFGTGPKAETAAIMAARRLGETLASRFGDINCVELTDTNWKKPSSIAKYFIKGGTIKCFSMVAKYATMAFEDIESAFSQRPDMVQPHPVSCAAETIRKMGGDDQHAVMAAGLAGGIGLSGGGCGALGAAVWMEAIGILGKPKGKIGLSNPETLGVIDRYLKASDYEFECVNVVGKRFETVEDHAAHIRNGGCQQIIEALAVLK